MRYAQIPGSIGAEECGIVPDQLGDRFRQFLQPAVVGEAPVVNSRVRTEEKLELAGNGRGDRRQAGGVELGGDAQRRIGCVRHDAIIQRLAPEFFKIAAGICGFQSITYRVIAAEAGLVTECCEYLVRRMCLVKGSNQWLDDADSAVERARVTPCFQV